MSEPVLSVRSLSAGYGKQAVIHELDLSLHRGERFGLLGPSGSGKSTLLLALLGLLPQRGGWVRGEVWLGDRNLLTLSGREARSLRGRAISLVPQSPLSALNPALSLQKHFEQCWKAHRSTDKAQLQQRMADLLQRVHLPSNAAFLGRKPGQISVGQAQRCTLALALLHRPALLIADEPTSSLDAVTQSEVVNLLRELSEEQGAALLFVSHDLLSVLRLCSSVAILSGGRLAETLPTEEIVFAQNETLRHLLQALPVPAELLLRYTAKSPPAVQGHLAPRAEEVPA